MPDIAQRRAALLRQREAVDAFVRQHPGEEGDIFGLVSRVSSAVLRALLAMTGLYERGHSNALKLHLRREEWHHPNLPPTLDGLTLLHVTDLHYNSNDDAFARAVEALLDGVEVDLCLMTGDYRFGHVGPTAHVLDKMRSLVPRIKARHGVFATPGNHDTLELLHGLRDFGVQTLVNEGMEVVINGAPLWLAGTDDSYCMKAADMEAACHGAREEHFIIALVHTPEVTADAEAHGVDMYLCGHTHGGQIRLPGLGALITSSTCERRYVHGRWQRGRMLGLTSAGLGTTSVPVRFNCPPECHLITLRCGG